MNNSGVAQHLKEDFFIALGENKTIKHLMLDAIAKIQPDSIRLLGKAVAMNAFRNGALESLSIGKWMQVGAATRNAFLDGLKISN